MIKRGIKERRWNSNVIKREMRTPGDKGRRGKKIHKKKKVKRKKRNGKTHW